MAKRARKRRSGGKARAKRGTPMKVHPHYANRVYDCRGIRAKNARGGGTHPRVVCGAQKK